MTDLLAIEAENLSYRYQRRSALTDIRLTFGCGVLGLLGPNGAGKTTLLRLLATATRPTTGTLRLLGRDPRVAAERAAIRRRLGYLPQDFGYFPEFTVAEFVEYFALLKGVPNQQVGAAVAQAISAVGLENEQRSKLRTLSSGMLRRVGIAQAVVNTPELLLLDEPTVGLDPEQRVAFRALIRAMGTRSTVVVSTHLVEDVAAACSTVAVLNQGRVVFQGTPADLVRRGSGDGLGDSPLERGYSAVVAGASRP